MIVGLTMLSEFQQYINNLTESSFYNFPKESELGEFLSIYAHVVSSKFRKTKILPDAEEDIKHKIEQCLLCKQPLKFSIPFGAYKAWKLDVDFVPEWAEVFNLSYLLKYAAHILEVYPYGVEFTYTYSDDVMYFISDIPKIRAEQYAKDFVKLLQIFNKVESRVQFHLVKINDLYGSSENYYIDFLKCFLEDLVFWDTKYDEVTKNRILTSSHHNLYPFGERRLADQPAEIQEKYYYYSALMTDAVDCLKERRKYNKDQDKIQLVGVRGPSKSINVGACETSTVHFWVGRGCLSFNRGVLKPYVYTISKLVKFKEENQIVECPISSVFSSVNKNFKTILYVLEEKK